MENVALAWLIIGRKVSYQHALPILIKGGPFSKMVLKVTRCKSSHIEKMRIRRWLVEDTHQN